MTNKIYPDVLRSYINDNTITRKLSRTGKYSAQFSKFIQFCDINNIDLGSLIECDARTIKLLINNNLPIPRCICGKITTILINKEGEYYPSRCSIACRSNDRKYTSKISKTKSIQYSDINWKTAIENKKIKTTYANYGVNYPMQDISIFEKQQVRCFKKDKNGLQGYEPFIFPFLQNLYDDIQLGLKYLKNNNMKIKWIDGTKIRHSYPDFFVPSINSFIEIKSMYTYQLHFNKLMKCKDALNLMNYGYIVAIVNPNKSYSFQTYNIKHIID